MNILEAIYQRRSIRKYQEKKVGRETLVELVKAGAAAPSAMNRQPWHFIIIDDPQDMDGLRKIMKFGRYNAPAAIIVCGNMKKTMPAIARDFWIEDCSAAMENILNAALHFCLGTVWLGAYPVGVIIKALSGYLGLPKHLVPLGVAYVGYPAEEHKPRTQYIDDIVSFGRIKNKSNQL